MNKHNSAKSSRFQQQGVPRRHSATTAITAKLSKTISVGDRRELNRILRKIAEISSLAKSPEAGSRAVVNLLRRSARCAIKQYSVQEDLRTLALSDELTGLHNRRGFFAIAGQQLKLARRNHRCALLFLADVDELKQINDRFGHSEGDLAIIRTANILRDTFRESDIVSRLGGDEFAVLAIEASSESQKDILPRLKDNLCAERSRHPNYRLSLSIGVARFNPCSAVTLGELLKYADRAMYEAKRASAPINSPVRVLMCRTHERRLRERNTGTVGSRQAIDDQKAS